MMSENLIKQYINGKEFPTKKILGHAIDDDIDIQFEFDVPFTATEDDIISKMTEVFLEKFQMSLMSFEEIE